MNRHLTTLFFTLILIILSNCKDSSIKDLPVLRIGYASHDHHSPLFIAAMNPDYFKQNGGIYLKEIVFKERYELVAGSKPVAEVRIIQSTGGKELIRKLNQDQFDMSFGGIPAILHFIDQNSTIRILAPVMAEGDGIFIKNELPITDWNSFKNYVSTAKTPLRIGYKIDISVQNIIFESALKEENISFSNNLDDQSVKITLINLHGAKNMIPSLKNGLIDGFVVNQPFLAMAEYQNLGKMIASLKELPPQGKWERIPCCALAGSADFVGKNKELSRLLVTLLREANLFIQEQPEHATKQVAEWLHLPIEVEKRSLRTIKFTPKFDRNWDQGLDFWIQTMLENGSLSGRIKDSTNNNTLKTILYDMDLYNNNVLKTAQ